jgi:hypothetical protein
MAGLFVALGGALLVGWQYYVKLASNKDLQDAIAEADRLDPGWRLEELESKRKVFPDAENAAVQILEIKKLGGAWPPNSMILPPETGEPGAGEEDRGESFVQTLDELSPEIQLSSDQTIRLRTELAKVQEALAKARELHRFRGGRYVVDWKPD